jgi:exonuclease VII small subunit
LPELEAKEKQLQEILTALGVEENGAKNEWSKSLDLDRTIVALKFGVALTAAWGDSLPVKALQAIKTAMEHLAKARKELTPLFGNTDAKPAPTPEAPR